MKFAGNTGAEFTRQLGSKITITGAKGDASSPATSAVQNGATNTHQNIFTKTSKDTLEIALNSELKGIQSIANGDNAKIALDKDAKTINLAVFLKLIKERIKLR
ncbi:hypothetical protein JFL59_05715 [Histophilus somni]|uniref:hypothetical protein n=1 Tax=Histophilus somni TaxID=731 RepID=UPI0018EA6BE4|nr:hypothetical protein [Histophilus somni]QQF69765.1 hypothetical protein JFL59_05715 [Histophilus somni]